LLCADPHIRRRINAGSGKLRVAVLIDLYLPAAAERGDKVDAVGCPPSAHRLSCTDAVLQGTVRPTGDAA